jgi:hypothetical protein
MVLPNNSPSLWLAMMTLARIDDLSLKKLAVEVRASAAAIIPAVGRCGHGMTAII